MRIVYIAGLGYSGSTILDMALGCHSNIIGLGEISQLLKADRTMLENKNSSYNQLLCSCGKRINECPFWKGGKQLLIGNSCLSQSERYQQLIAYFEEMYGNDCLLVDSSKVSSDYLTAVNHQHDLKVIFLVRDFRSWCYSRKRKAGRNFLIHGYQWLKYSLGVLRFLKKNNFCYKMVGYEELALYPDVMLNEICDFIGVEYEPQMLSPEKTKSHIAAGNAARGDAEKRVRIRYDARWMTSSSIALYSIPLFPLLIFNRRLVYSNFLKKRVDAFGRPGDDFLLFSVKKKEEMIRHTGEIK